MLRSTMTSILSITTFLTCGLLAQNVGIGTTAPTELLHIDGGNLKLDNPARPWLIFDQTAGTLGGGLQWWLDGAGEMELFYDDVNNDLRFWDTQAGLPRLILQRTGNLGIGALPTSALEVAGELELGEDVWSTIKSRNDVSQLRLFSSLNYYKGAYIVANSAGFGSSPGSIFITHGDFTAQAPPSFIQFRYANNGFVTTHMVLTDSGDLGIGTITPEARLDVVGGAQIDGNTFVVDDISRRVGIGTGTPEKKLDVFGGAQIDDSTFVVDDATHRVGIGTTSPESALHVAGIVALDAYLKFNNLAGLVFRNAANIARMIIQDDGNVGIGVFLPSEKLHVMGDARFESTGGNQIIIEGTSGLCEVEFQNDGLFGASVGYDIAEDRLFLYEGGNVFVKNGNLGIGVGPTNKIDVAGGAHCTGTNWVNASSKLLKENFHTLNQDQILAKLMDIPITEWNYISEGSEIRHIGPMAEDFYAAFGLGQDDASISTIDAAGISLAAVQALQEQNEVLRKENAEIRRLLEDLTQRVEELAAFVRE